VVDDAVRGLAARAFLVAMGLAMPAPGWSAAPPPPEATATRPEDRVIFDREATRKALTGRAMGRGELWTPALADVTALEQKLPAYLRRAYKDQDRRREPLWKRAPHYKRQYLGITQKGERTIYANFFCEIFGPHPEDWKTILVDVDDGGDCYFQVEYDVKAGTFHDLSVNGEA
jgi:hypothetical protein